MADHGVEQAAHALAVIAKDLTQARQVLRRDLDDVAARRFAERKLVRFECCGRVR